MIEEMAQFLGAGGDEREAVVIVTRAILIVGVYFSFYFKNPGFAEEREWRLGVINKKAEILEGVSFRPSRFGLAPYAAIDLCAEDAACPVKELVLGPRHDRSLAFRAARLFLKQRGCAGAEINFSKASYR
jgi:hypothetical protein